MTLARIVNRGDGPKNREGTSELRSIRSWSIFAPGIRGMLSQPLCLFLLRKCRPRSNTFATTRRRSMRSTSLSWSGFARVIRRRLWLNWRRATRSLWHCARDSRPPDELFVAPAIHSPLIHNERKREAPTGEQLDELPND